MKNNDLNLYYEKSGRGKPLILLHGNGQTHKIFDKAIPLLAKYFTVYAIDTRGHGQSDSVSIFCYKDIADDVKNFIEILELDQPVLYGFSDGGIAGLLLACQYPQLLSQLIISGANTEVTGIKSSWLKTFQLIYAVTKDPKIGMVLNPPGITSAMLHRIMIPTTVLAGSRDMVKKNHTQYIARNIRNSRLRILRGESHGSYVVHSRKIGELIIEEVFKHMYTRRLQ